MSEKTGNSDLRSNQRKAVAALASGRTVKQAAETAGCAVSTIYRWKSEAVFANALRKADAENLREISRKLTAATNDALSVLLAVMNDKETPASVKVRAAGEVLAHRARFYDIVNMQDALDDVEARLTQGGL